MSTDDSFNIYAIGQTVVIEGYNVDEDGVPTTPVGAYILIKPEGGAEVELAITEDPVGHIFHEYLAIEGGRFFYRVGTVDDAVERFFYVKPSQFAAPFGPP